MRNVNEVLTLSASAIALMPVVLYVPLPYSSTPQRQVHDKFKNVMEVVSIFLPFRQALKIVREKVDHREWCTQYIWLAG